MTFIEHLKKTLAENQIMVVLIALLLGLALPHQLKFLNAFSTQLLIIVFFTSSLRLSLHELLAYGHDLKMLALANAFMLIVLPFALFYPFLFVSHDWALALLILGAMPTGMTIALIADFFGGKTSLALLITATTSLLAPFTIPLVLKIAVGQSVDIPMFRMFWSLVLTIVLPFTLAMVVKRRVPKLVAHYDESWRKISIGAFGLLIAGIVADSSGGTLVALTWQDVLILTAFILWMGILTWISYALVSWRTPSERITIALSMLYLNNTLALFIADRFFPNPGVLPKLVLLLLVINLLLPPLKWAAGRLTKQSRIIHFNPLT